MMSKRNKRVTCVCGRRINLIRPTVSTWQGDLGKSHAHCVPCKLEWHWNHGRVYAHPYTPKGAEKPKERQSKPRVEFVKTERLSIKPKMEITPAGLFMDIAKVK